jgi:hypothetical protein
MLRTLCVAALLCLAGPAMAQHHHHPPEHADIHSKFYQDWERPDQPGVSCCSDKDCAPAEARMVNGKWQAKRATDATWIDVPEAKIERRRDSPDGRNHLCEAYGMVFCFIAGAGT